MTRQGRGAYLDCASFWAGSLLRALGLAGSVMAALAFLAPSGTAIAGSRDADQFLIVDCLLPGQIRKLGTMVTYVTPRRPIRTTARDCEIRGGEYVAQDRASYTTSFKTWLEPAKAGDPKAQTFLGELYEKGLGTEPDYAAAAEWYRRAAEQGYAPAMINLATLYEKGQGVAQSQTKAVEWYRRASGLENIVLAAATDTTVPASNPDAENLRAELEVQTQEIVALNREIVNLREELARTHRKLEMRESEIETEKRGYLDETKQLEEARASLRAQLKELEVERARLDSERRKAESTNRESQTEIARLAEEVAERESSLATWAVQLEAQFDELKEKSERIKELEKEIVRLRNEADNKEARLAAVGAQEVGTETPVAVAAGPVIQIIDPTLRKVRGDPIAHVDDGISERPIIGKIASEEEIISVTVNDRSVNLESTGVFHGTVKLNGEETAVRVVAVDRLGRRSANSFRLRVVKPRTSSEAQTVAAQSALPEVVIPRENFGRFYALVIGNNKYRHLPRLDSAVPDARAVSTILSERYGFDVMDLIDADRYEILSALNRMRENLTDEDNLLIYYAGHGVIDEVNQRGQWLPIDAEPDNTANWISNVAITDIINSMNARHVMVIADSCYSGTLTRSALTRLSAGMTPEARRHWILKMIEKRSRTALTSGGLQPVLDSGGGGHSVFARALLDALTENASLLEGQALYRDVSARVSYAADSIEVEQIPEYAPIRYAGHEAGDFFFLPVP